MARMNRTQLAQELHELARTALEARNYLLCAAYCKTLDDLELIDDVERRRDEPRNLRHVPLLGTTRDERPVRGAFAGDQLHGHVALDERDPAGRCGVCGTAGVLQCPVCSDPPRPGLYRGSCERCGTFWPHPSVPEITCSQCGRTAQYDVDAGRYVHLMPSVPRHEVLLPLPFEQDPPAPGSPDLQTSDTAVLRLPDDDADPRGRWPEY